MTFTPRPLRGTCHVMLHGTDPAFPNQLPHSKEVWAWGTAGRGLTVIPNAFVIT